jgi:predicted flap endonuclease-1-like 5' DNA nuclease
MAWLQENMIIAVVGLVVAIVLLWWLFGRNRPEEIAPPVAPPAEPKKPLEAVKPEIVAAEPARFKPKEPAPAPSVPPPPAPAPVAETPPPPAPKPAPAAEIPEEPTVPAEPAPEPAAEAPPPAPAPTPAAKADNLQLLKGIGPKLAGLLNGLGVTSFQQIADWTDADIAAIDPQLGAFQGRIARDNIVDQAAYLARGDKAGSKRNMARLAESFRRRYGRLDRRARDAQYRSAFVAPELAG